MKQTIIEKIISRKSDSAVSAGQVAWMNIDVRSARDFGGANVVKNLLEHYKDNYIADPNKTCFTFDCNVPANTTGYADNQQICRVFAREQEIPLYDINEGIGSHVAIEQGLVVPGDIMVGTDSHLNIVGAIGAFGQGMGDQDIAFAFKTGRSWFEMPHTMRVDINGSFSYPTTAKDLTLFIIGRLGTKGALGRAVEFYGPCIDALSLSGRITLASMATEMGAIAAFMVPDTNIINYCKARSGREVQAITADPGASYIESLEIDVNNLSPQVARPNSPADVISAKELQNISIDSAFIGSCTNGRYEDFIIAASILKDKKVAEGVMLKIVPATSEVFDRMLDDGLVKIFRQAGALVSNPGCGGCASGQIGIIGENEIQISTSNRNFRGKQGKGDTYLASAATAATSALKGKIVCPSEVEHSLLEFIPDEKYGRIIDKKKAITKVNSPQQSETKSEAEKKSELKNQNPTEEIIRGRAYKIVNGNGTLVDDIDTDMIFHNQYLHIKDIEQMGQYTFDNLDGYEDFARSVQPGDIVLLGKNFGCGSSRQQAVDCFRSLGVSLLISESTGAIYKRNAINSGMGLLECEKLSDVKINHRDELEVNVKTGEIINNTTRVKIKTSPFSPVQWDIYQAGDLFVYGETLS